MNDKISKELTSIENEFNAIEEKLQDPNVLSDKNQYVSLSKRLSELQEIMGVYSQYKKVEDNIKTNKELLNTETDKDMIEMANADLQSDAVLLENLFVEIKKLLIPKDPMDDKNVIIEIRAGTGGDESALFCGDMFRMYSRYAEKRKWKNEILSYSETEIGGYKEIVFMLSGKSVNADMKYESGTHRVQRIPTTEANGRIHTSAVTIGVLPEIEETEIVIKDEDLKIDVYRSSSAGGQSVNTTDSAVRITHLPTNLVVTCQDERSQLKNKQRAMKILRSKLYEQEEERKQKQRAENRKNQIGTGDRSERIRTYNYPQNRITDHRINLTLYKLDLMMEGDIDELIESLKIANQNLINGDI